MPLLFQSSLEISISLETGDLMANLAGLDRTWAWPRMDFQTYPTSLVRSTECRLAQSAADFATDDA